MCFENDGEMARGLNSVFNKEWTKQTVQEQLQPEARSSFSREKLYTLPL